MRREAQIDYERGLSWENTRKSREDARKQKKKEENRREIDRLHEERSIEEE